MYALTVLIVVLIIYLLWRMMTSAAMTETHNVGGLPVRVLGSYANRNDAARLMGELNGRIMRLLGILRSKYAIGATDSEARRANQQTTEWRECVGALLRGFNYEETQENPPGSADTAYSLGKGRVIRICLRQGANTEHLMDINTLVFVMLHEASHIAAFDVWGHPPRFWSAFKTLLREAIEARIYKPIDYEATPIDYCGFEINHNPVFDDRISAL